MTFKGETEFEEWAVRFPEFYEPGTRLEKEFRLTRKLVLAARRWTTHVDERVKQKTGHSRARWQTLSALTFSEGPVATVELASRLAVQWPTLVRILNDLEKSDLIRREKDPNDHRSRLVSITAEGRRVMARVQDVLDPMRTRALAEFSDDELVVAEGVLDRLFKVLVREFTVD
jgi:MarR family transcriptional regulator, transcriptional regulator for hemolysin